MSQYSMITNSSTADADPDDGTWTRVEFLTEQGGEQNSSISPSFDLHFHCLIIFHKHLQNSHVRTRHIRFWLNRLKILQIWWGRSVRRTCWKIKTSYLRRFEWVVALSMSHVHHSDCDRTRQSPHRQTDDRNGTQPNCEVKIAISIVLSDSASFGSVCRWDGNAYTDSSIPLLLWTSRNFRVSNCESRFECCAGRIRVKSIPDVLIQHDHFRSRFWI
jgi:hypothetical protein